MRALASHSTVLTPCTDKQHLLIGHGYFLHPEKQIKKRTVRPRDTDEVIKMYLLWRNRLSKPIPMSTYCPSLRSAS